MKCDIYDRYQMWVRLYYNGTYVNCPQTEIGLDLPEITHVYVYSEEAKCSVSLLSNREIIMRYDKDGRIYCQTWPVPDPIFFETLRERVIDAHAMHM